MSTQVAQTILAQLGGRRFLLMTGARNLVATENSLTFNLPIGKAKRVTIELTPADTYSVTFWARKGPSSDTEGVYCDSLASLVSRKTGLALSLGGLS